MDEKQKAELDHILERAREENKEALSGLDPEQRRQAEEANRRSVQLRQEAELHAEALARARAAVEAINRSLNEVERKIEVGGEGSASNAEGIKTSVSLSLRLADNSGAPLALVCTGAHVVAQLTPPWRAVPGSSSATADSFPPPETLGETPVREASVEWFTTQLLHWLKRIM